MRVRIRAPCQLTHCLSNYFCNISIYFLCILITLLSSPGLLQTLVPHSDKSRGLMLHHFGYQFCVRYVLFSDLISALNICVYQKFAIYQCVFIYYQSEQFHLLLYERIFSYLNNSFALFIVAHFVLSGVIFASKKQIWWSVKLGLGCKQMPMTLMIPSRMTSCFLCL